jgi:hypothetical protein
MLFELSAKDFSKKFVLWLERRIHTTVWSRRCTFVILYIEKIDTYILLQIVHFMIRGMMCVCVCVCVCSFLKTTIIAATKKK